MTTLAAVLKDEIRRLARKEIKVRTGSTARAVAQYRRDIARLKREQRELEKRLAFLESQARRTSPSPTTSAKVSGDGRFSARSVKAQRRRTGLSAANYAKLVGVSPLTIYNWENKKSRPRQGQLAALIALRGLGKRAAQARFAQLATKQRPRPRRK